MMRGKHVASRNTCVFNSKSQCLRVQCLSPCLAVRKRQPNGCTLFAAIGFYLMSANVFYCDYKVLIVLQLVNNTFADVCGLMRTVLIYEHVRKRQSAFADAYVK